MATGKFSYYESDEGSDAVMDLLDDGNVEDALRLAEEGLKQHPNDETAEKLVIWMYIHNNRIEEADKLFEKYKNDETESTIRLRFSLAALHGHPKQALDSFFLALKSEKIELTEWVNTIDDMFESLPHTLLAPYLVRVAALAGTDCDSIARLGGLIMDCHQYREAAEVLEKALDINAYDIYCWQDLARCYLELADFDRCLDACTYGIAIDEKNPLLNFLSGFINYQKKNYREAIAQLDVMRQFAEGRLKTDLHHVPLDNLHYQITITYEFLGFAYLEIEELDKSVECFEILSEREPDKTYIWIQLASLFLLKGDSPKAEEYIIKALETNPKDTSAIAMSVSILTTMQRFDDALLGLKKLIRLKPHNANYKLACAELLFHLGRKEEADALFRKLLNSKPKRRFILEALHLYFSSIDDADALNQLEDLNRK